MLLLNIGLSNLSLSIEPDAPECLMLEVINNASSMAALRANIAQYSEELSKPIDYLVRKASDRERERFR
eukprot:15365285-Ditylum_brightwellii.AAC.1